MVTENEVALTDDEDVTPEELLTKIKDEQKGQPEPVVEPDRPKSVSLVSEPDGETSESEEDKPSKTESTSDSEDSPVPFSKDDKTETEEWMKKKGFKNVQAMAQSLRNLEREFHKRTPSPQQGADAPIPAQPDQARGAYNQPQYPVDEIAKRYNMDPDDLRRVGQLSNDIANYEVNRQIKPLVGEIKRLNQELEKRNTYDRVENDPTFRDPKVLKEMHEIVDKDPSIVQKDPYWMRNVHSAALLNIGRRYLERGIVPEEAPVTAGQGPKRPPMSKGGSGQGRTVSPLRPISDEITPTQFARLPLAEQEKYLRKRGAIPLDE